VTNERLHVLCVDDEALVLQGLVLNLRPHYRISTATSGQDGLALLDGSDPPAVVVSDMRMPEMNGAVFLSQVRERSPDTVRLLLTGHADIESAMAAVNHGQIFRFLTKPCPSPVFLSAINAAAEQYRLVTAERVLLEQTLRGSIKALTDVLSMSSPLAFGRAIRLKRRASDLLAALGVPMPWQLEVAIMLSQIGCVTLPPATAEKFYFGRPMGADENDMVQALPALAVQIIESIPRLEAVRAILQLQEHDFDGAGAPSTSPSGPGLPLGARVLKIVSDWDSLEVSGMASGPAMAAMQQRRGRYDPKLLDALVRLNHSVPLGGLRQADLASLKAGMFLAQDVLSEDGHLLVARGQEVTLSLLRRLRNLAPGSVREPIQVSVPAERKP
jgi:response regulator RpfG family c-di-GMP phosphodiesterase